MRTWPDPRSRCPLFCLFRGFLWKVPFLLLINSTFILSPMGFFFVEQSFSPKLRLGPKPFLTFSLDHSLRRFLTPFFSPLILPQKCSNCAFFLLFPAVPCPPSLSPSLRVPTSNLSTVVDPAHDHHPLHFCVFPNAVTALLPLPPPVSEAPFARRASSPLWPLRSSSPSGFFDKRGLGQECAPQVS